MKYKSPLSWKKERFCDVAEIVTGSTPSTTDQSNYGFDIPFIGQYLCQFSPESREDFNGELSFKRGLAEVVILKNSVKVFRKVFLI